VAVASAWPRARRQLGRWPHRPACSALLRTATARCSSPYPPELLTLCLLKDPLASTSLADFWGRRWNVTQSLVLKGLLYDPLVEGCLLPRGLQPPAGRQQAQQGPAGESAGKAAAAVHKQRGGSAAGSTGARRPPASASKVRAAAQFWVHPQLSSITSSLAGAAATGQADRPSTQPLPAELRHMQASAQQVIRSISCKRPAGRAPQPGDTRAGSRPAASPASTPSARHHSSSASLSTSTASSGVAGAGAGSSGAPSRLRRQLATALVFVWSGVEHEVFHWYALGRFSGGRWFSFFAVQVSGRRGWGELGSVVRCEARLPRCCAAAGKTCSPGVGSGCRVLMCSQQPRTSLHPDLLPALPPARARWWRASSCSSSQGARWGWSCRAPCPARWRWRCWSTARLAGSSRCCRTRQ
jgi:hypothetical protein